jgi:DNA replication protein DnaC
MEPLQSAVNRAMETMPQSSTQNYNDNSTNDASVPKAKVREAYTCWVCKDMGWLYAANSQGEIIWEPGNKPKIIRCKCKDGLDFERRRRHLLSIDGLTSQERHVRFGDLIRNEYNGAAIRTVEECTEWRHGMVTLIGGPGVGKSTLLQCAVNAAREANVPAVYTTVTDLLDYLRQAYNPNVEVTFDARWETLIRCELLALDELDEFNTTPWAIERFLRLIDERWRAMDRCMTICATNSRLNSLPEKVVSRLRDAKAHVIEMRGDDFRRYQR